MLPKDALRILRAHETLLRERDIKYEKLGCGAYMFVVYDLNFENAVIHRHWSLDALLENYMTCFTKPHHIEINYAYLKYAGLRTPEEKAYAITPFSNRFSMYRGEPEEVTLPIDENEGFSEEFLRVG